MINKPLAVIVFDDDGDEVMQILWDAVEELQKQGLNVGGLLNKKNQDGTFIGGLFVLLVTSVNSQFWLIAVKVLAAVV